MMIRCPVCGWPGLSEPPRSSAGGSYEICPSCGFEFGVTDDDAGMTYEAWRRQWIENGMEFRDGFESAPPGWSPKAQLKDAGLA